MTLIYFPNKKSQFVIRILLNTIFIHTQLNVLYDNVLSDEKHYVLSLMASLGNTK